MIYYLIWIIVTLINRNGIYLILILLIDMLLVYLLNFGDCFSLKFDSSRAPKPIIIRYSSIIFENCWNGKTISNMFRACCVRLFFENSPTFIHIILIQIFWDQTLESTFYRWKPEVKRGFITFSVTQIMVETVFDSELLASTYWQHLFTAKSYMGF